MLANHTRPASAQRGLTLIESCAVAAIAVVLVGSAVPSFDGVLQRRHLEGRATELAIDLQWLRSEVVAQNRTMRISFQKPSGGTCYVIHAGSAGGCQCVGDGPAQCSGDSFAIKNVFLPDSGPVRLQANMSTMVFDPIHGTSTPAGTLKLIDRQNRTNQHTVNIMGRTRSCSPNGQVPGYRAC